MKNSLLFGCGIILFAAFFVSCQKDQSIDAFEEEQQAQVRKKICSCTFSTNASATLNDDFGEIWTATLHYTKSNGSPGIVSLGNVFGLPSSAGFNPSIPQDFYWDFEYDNTLTGNGNTAAGTAIVSVVCNGDPGPISPNFPAQTQYNIGVGTTTYFNQLDSEINANCVAFGVY